jgi:hypothetical protein
LNPNNTLKEKTKPNGAFGFFPNLEDENSLSISWTGREFPLRNKDFWQFSHYISPSSDEV